MEKTMTMTRKTARVESGCIGTGHLLLPVLTTVPGWTPSASRRVIAGPAEFAANGAGMGFAAGYATPNPTNDVHRSATGSPPV